MDGLWRRSVFQEILRSSLPPQDRALTSLFRCKTKPKGGEFDKCKVRLVVQGQHMRRKGGDSWVITTTLPAQYRLPADSAPFLVWLHNKICSIITLIFSQAFVQGELLPGASHNGKVYVSWQPGYDEDPLYVCHLLKPLYGMPSATRAWHTNMPAFLVKEGCATLGFEKDVWTVTIDGACILPGAWYSHPECEWSQPLISGCLHTHSPTLLFFLRIQTVSSRCLIPKTVAGIPKGSSKVIKQFWKFTIAYDQCRESGLIVRKASITDRANSCISANASFNLFFLSRPWKILVYRFKLCGHELAENTMIHPMKSIIPAFCIQQKAVGYPLLTFA